MSCIAECGGQATPQCWVSRAASWPNWSNQYIKAIIVRLDLRRRKSSRESHNCKVKSCRKYRESGRFLVTNRHPGVIAPPVCAGQGLVFESPYSWSPKNYRKRGIIGKFPLGGCGIGSADSAGRCNSCRPRIRHLAQSPRPATLARFPQFPRPPRSANSRCHAANDLPFFSPASACHLLNLSKIDVKGKRRACLPAAWRLEAESCLSVQ